MRVNSNQQTAFFQKGKVNAPAGRGQQSMVTALEPIESFEQSDMSEVMHSGLFSF